MPWVLKVIGVSCLRQEGSLTRVAKYLLVTSWGWGDLLEKRGSPRQCGDVTSSTHRKWCHQAVSATLWYLGKNYGENGFNCTVVAQVPEHYLVVVCDNITACACWKWCYHITNNIAWAVLSLLLSPWPSQLICGRRAYTGDPPPPASTRRADNPTIEWMNK